MGTAVFGDEPEIHQTVARTKQPVRKSCAEPRNGCNGCARDPSWRISHTRTLSVDVSLCDFADVACKKGRNYDIPDTRPDSDFAVDAVAMGPRMMAHLCDMALGLLKP